MLFNILPEAIAKELKKTDRVRPLHYETATVRFTDFVGFTQWLLNEPGGMGLRLMIVQNDLKPGRGGVSVLANRSSRETILEKRRLFY